MAKIFSRKFGYDIALAGYHSLSIDELCIIHGFKVADLHIKLYSRGLENIYTAFKMIPFKISAYNVLFRRDFRSWASEVIERFNPDIILFNDDIPYLDSKIFKNRAVYLYVNFPLLAQNASIVPILKKTRSISESINDSFLRAFGNRIIYPYPHEICNAIIANSSVTYRALKKIGINGTISLLPPFICKSCRGIREKENVIVSLGSFSKHKNYEMLIEGFINSELTGWKLEIMGFGRDLTYVKRLEKLILRSRTTKEILLKIDLPKEEIDQRTSRSSIIVHSAMFEPFGIAPLEAMANASIPIVFKSEYSGIWTDVLERGKYGAGFENSHDLSSQLSLIAQRLSQDSQTKVLKRAESYSEEKFISALRSTMEF
jgi:glycosyltransferase involved in cell wall biosynthesis